MRTFFEVKMLLILFAGLVFSAPSVGAEKNMFDNERECNIARELIALGDYDYYEPKYFGLKGNNPVDGKSTVAAPIERDWCYKMLTVSGEKWVVQKSGTVLLFHKNADGTLGEPYAREDCGNPIYSVAEEDSKPVAEATIRCDFGNGRIVTVPKTEDCFKTVTITPETTKQHEPVPVGDPIFINLSPPPPQPVVVYVRQSPSYNYGYGYYPRRLHYGYRDYGYSRDRDHDVTNVTITNVVRQRVPPTISAPTGGFNTRPVTGGFNTGPVAGGFNTRP
ncbi:MAG: hypothetical protein AAB488_00980 [Patescibacteria group bacterium]